MSKTQTPRIDISKLSLVEIDRRITKIKKVDLSNKEEPVNASFEISLTPLFSVERNAIKIELAVSISISGEEEEFIDVGDFEYDFVFQYREISEHLNEKGDLNPEIILTCATISYSTLRGIIYTEAKGSCIERAILPVVSGKELVSNASK